MSGQVEPQRYAPKDPEVGFDQAASEKMTPDKRQSRLCTSIRLLIATMFSLIVLTAAVLLVIHLHRQPHTSSDHPHGSNPTHTTFNLFNTKTAYQTAHQILITKRGDATPGIFETETLKAIHEKLINEGCIMEQFHYIGRHAARYPNLEQTNSINQNLPQIISRIPMHNDDSIGNTSGPSNNSNHYLESYRHWQSIFSAAKQNLLVKKGIDETRAQTQRFKNLFGQFFDAKQTQISVDVTRHPRTAQTAMIFMKAFDNYQNDQCDLSSVSLEDTELSLTKTVGDCVSALIERHKSAFSNNQTFTELHDTCQILNLKQPRHEIELFTKKPARVQTIIDKISLQLNLTQKLTREEFKAIQQVCHYETANFNHSIWCDLFQDEDLEFLEYKDDVKDYYENLLSDISEDGPQKLFTSSSCLFTKIFEKSYLDYRFGEKTADRIAHFHFTHSAVIQRLIGAMMFESLSRGSSFSKNTIDNLLNNLGSAPPKDRTWRSSIISPFSANIAFNVYKCERPNGFVDHKIVTSVNEIPIKPGQCPEIACETEIFQQQSGLTSTNACSPSDLCRQLPVVTVV